MADESSTKGFHSTGPAFWSYVFPSRSSCYSSPSSPDPSDKLPTCGSGAPDYNEMIAAAMYDSIHNNYDYILQTQYGMGMDKSGDIWRGISTTPTVSSHVRQASYERPSEKHYVTAAEATPKPPVMNKKQLYKAFVLKPREEEEAAKRSKWYPWCC